MKILIFEYVGIHIYAYSNIKCRDGKIVGICISVLAASLDL